MLKSLITKLIQQKDLTAQEAGDAILNFLETDNVAQISAFLTLLKAKGETSTEVLGIVQAMQSKMQTINIDEPTLDIVGTGGDGASTINISTASAILAATCGVKIVKHGNRAISSQCGSADFLEALGINIEMHPDSVIESVKQTGFGFCYAPTYHPAMAKIKKVRTALGIPTVFNIIGPLLNPAQADYLMIGVANPSLLPLVADVLLKSTVKHAIVFHGQGLDEITTLGPIQVIEIKGRKNEYEIDPSEFGFKKSSLSDLQGGNAKENIAIVQEVFRTKTGPIADTLILNAGFANYLYGITNSIEQGILLAKKQLENGTAQKKLEGI